MIDRNGRKWPLIKRDRRWRFEDDEDFRVDTQKIDELVRQFAEAKASSFKKEEIEDLGTFGLRAPAMVVSLSDGKKNEAVLIGGPSKEDKEKIHAKMKGRAELVTVDKWLLSYLPQNRDEIREEEKVKEEKKKKPR